MEAAVRIIGAWAMWRRLLSIAALALPASACSLLVDADVGVISDAGGAAADADGLRRVPDSVVLIMRDVESIIRFSDDPDGPGSCLSEEVAGCEILTCIAGEEPLPRPAAGLVSVSTEGGDQSYPPDGDGLYPTLPAASWEDGQEVDVAAAGGEVPAFDVSLTGPGDVDAVTSPAFPDPIVRRDQPLAVAWTGADSQAVMVLSCPGTPVVQLRCPFPDGLSGEVPVAALARIPACSGDLYLLTEDRRVLEPGAGWAVRVALRGAILSTQATIE